MARKAAAEPESGTTNVNIADFQRTRDSVIVALATLQSSVQDLSRAYINHANTVLNPGRSGTLDVGLTNTLVEAGLLGVSGQHPSLGVEQPEDGGKKKRKRAKHDPNAPKRALTPYFLYMQTARSQIARELGPNAKPKEVADEGTRRWSSMKDEDKAVWNEEYQKNLAVYRVKTAAYKAQQPVPSDEEAQRLVEAGKVPTHIPEPEIEAEAEDEEEESEESPEPVKEPTPPKAKRRKSEKVAPVAEPAPAPAPVKATPKKEKSTKKAKKEATPPPAPVAPASEKKKKSKKAA